MEQVTRVGKRRMVLQRVRKADSKYVLQLIRPCHLLWGKHRIYATNTRLMIVETPQSQHLESESIQLRDSKSGFDALPSSERQEGSCRTQGTAGAILNVRAAVYGAI